MTRKPADDGLPLLLSVLDIAEQARSSAGEMASAAAALLLASLRAMPEDKRKIYLQVLTRGFFESVDAESIATGPVRLN